MPGSDVGWRRGKPVVIALLYEDQNTPGIGVEVMEVTFSIAKAIAMGRPVSRDSPSVSPGHREFMIGAATTACAGICDHKSAIAIPWLQKI